VERGGGVLDQQQHLAAADARIEAKNSAGARRRYEGKAVGDAQKGDDLLASKRGKAPCDICGSWAL